MLPIHIIHQIAQALAEKYPESATDYFRMSEAISLVSDGADIIAAREEVPSDVAYEDAFDDWHDAVRYDETVWYEPIVQKQRMNSLYGQRLEKEKACYTLGMTVAVNNGQNLDEETWEWVKHGVFERYQRKKAKFPSIPKYAEVYIVGDPGHLEVTFYRDCPHEMRNGFTYYCI